MNPKNVPVVLAAGLSVIGVGVLLWMRADLKKGRRR